MATKKVKIETPEQTRTKVQKEKNAASVIGGFFSEGLLYRRLVIKMANNHNYWTMVNDMALVGFSKKQVDTAIEMITLAGKWRK